VQRLHGAIRAYKLFPKDWELKNQTFTRHTSVYPTYFEHGRYFAPMRAFAPIIGLLSLIFITSASYDIITEQNLTDKTLIFLMIAINAGLFALIADVIDKRAGR
jgi:hypothetical protein